MAEVEQVMHITIETASANLNSTLMDYKTRWGTEVYSKRVKKVESCRVNIG